MKWDLHWQSLAGVQEDLQFPILLLHGNGPVEYALRQSHGHWKARSKHFVKLNKERRKDIQGDEERLGLYPEYHHVLKDVVLWVDSSS